MKSRSSVVLHAHEIGCSTALSGARTSESLALVPVHSITYRVRKSRFMSS